MPRFTLDYGSEEARAKFRALDYFTQAYVTAAYHAGVEGGPKGHEPTLADLAPEAFDQIRAECRQFQAENAQDLARAWDLADNCDDEQAGRDFWLTRVGSGAGFFDGLWPEPFATSLTRAAKAAGTRDLYFGDDGKIYVFPHRAVEPTQSDVASTCSPPNEGASPCPT